MDGETDPGERDSVMLAAVSGGASGKTWVEGRMRLGSVLIQFALCGVGYNVADDEQWWGL